MKQRLKGKTYQIDQELCKIDIPNEVEELLISEAPKKRNGCNLKQI